MITAKIIADSQAPSRNRITTMMVTFPRMILAELNTHRLFSRNSASSRAIPFAKALKSVISNPFIPIAVQKHHTGMQGSDYLDMDAEYTFEEIRAELHEFLVKNFRNEDGTWDEDYLVVDEVLNKYVLPLLDNGEFITWRKWWLKARDLVVAAATISFAMGATKQICNRLLEPFMWHTVLITATEWENFFELRCPVYQGKNTTWKSWKSLLQDAKNDSMVFADDYAQLVNADTLFKLQHNKGQSEIHMMALAEAMYDAYQESVPKELKAGEWHLPFADDMDFDTLAANYGEDVAAEMIFKVSTARCARVSYTVVGEESKAYDFKKDCELYDKLVSSGHMSPTEHCARVMDKTEYGRFTKGSIFSYNDELFARTSNGWCNNFRGFIQLRYLIENTKHGA
jgi:uncharacterized cupredoxin-like copper-binding protein